MTEQQRLDAFIVAYNALVQLYGVQLAAAVEVKRYGPMAQCEAVLTPSFVAEWQPTLERQAEKVANNGDGI